jgi:hypothetical protein
MMKNERWMSSNEKLVYCLDCSKWWYTKVWKWTAIGKVVSESDEVKKCPHCEIFELKSEVAKLERKLDALCAETSEIPNE